MIQVKNLNMTYQVYKKQIGLLSTIKGLINRKYDSIQALKDINLFIDEGEIIGFIGPNGAGKTTFLKVLSGLLYPTSGEVKVDKYIPFERKKDFRKMISLVMGQKSQLMWDIAPIETFYVNRAIYEIDKKVFHNTLNELVELLDVKHCLNTPVRQLSLGERMKMEIIASLLHFPRVLFLDEPTIGLDLKSQIAMRDFIKTYISNRKITVIITSHYMEDIKSLCKRIVMINKGTLIYDGDIENLYKSKSEYKYISLKTSQDTIDSITNYISSYELVDDNYKIKVSPELINDVIDQLFKNGNVKDLTIENQPIEEIILDILKKGESEDGQVLNVL